MQLGDIFQHPKNGFIVARAPANRTMSILSFNGNSREIWNNCKDDRQIVPVFRTRGGKVIYVASAHYQWAGRETAYQRYSQDFAGAYAYMKTYYPQLADRLESDYTMQMLPIKC